MMQNTAIVGEKILRAARQYVKSNLADAVKEAASRLPPESVADDTKLYEALELDEEVDGWTKARQQVHGHWQFVLIPSSIPNAFVSEMLPRRIFITTAMFEEFIASQDELALILGHEISHLILGHSSTMNSFESSYRTLEVLLLSLDPTSGLLSLAFMGFLASVRSAIGAGYSRDHERQADELGVKLCAMACYDTRAASEVMHKMHVENVESGGATANMPSFFDSHPPSDERYRSLLDESKNENPNKYEENCATLKSLFFEAIKPEVRGSPEEVRAKLRTLKIQNEVN